jgi:hypothetical protein
MRPFQVGDIVRDCSLDEVTPEWQHDQVLYRVTATAVNSEWAPAPLAIHMKDGQRAVQQYLTLERADGQPHFHTLCSQEAFLSSGPRYEVVKSVEEIFENENGSWQLETQVNQWLDANPAIEILEFFPVSISTSVAVAAVKTTNEIQITTRNDNGYSPTPPSLEERTKESSVAAVGIYYTER